MKRIFHFIAFALAGCATRPPPTTIPVRTVVAEPTGRADRLVVFLRGISNQPEEFERSGFFALARQRWPRGRFIAPDLHLGYYLDRSAAERLKADVIDPARSAGIHRISLVGISLGGLGALLYQLQYPGDVDEIILLAPYLGEKEVWQEIVERGSLADWRPGTIDPDDYSRRLWSDLRDHWVVNTKDVRVELACGKGDRFVKPDRLFAESFLAPKDVAWVPGRHNWKTWSRGFAQLSESHGDGE